MRCYSVIMSVAFTALWILAASLDLQANDIKKPDKSPQPEKSIKKQKETKEGIFQFDNPAHQNMLNKPTLPVKKVPDPEIDKLIESMFSTMRRHGGGVGISANQVGHPLQISITTDPFDLEHPGNYKVFINPVITDASKKVHCFWHGCLSALDGQFGKVATWQEVTVSALDQQGKSFTETLTGTNAVIFQHEFRHLLGGGYMNHASSSRSEAEMFQAMLKEMKEKKFSYLELCKDGEKPLLDDYQVGETIDGYSKRISVKSFDKILDKGLNAPMKKEPPNQKIKKSKFSPVLTSHCLFAQNEPLQLEIDVTGVSEPELNQVSSSTQNRIESSSDTGQFLRKLDGVSSGRKGGKGFEPIIRGQQQSQLNIMFGGAQVTSACPGRMDPPTSYVSMVGYDRIHVSKGYESVTEGSGGSGGAVYFERDTPGFNQSDFSGRVGASYKSNINSKSLYTDMAMGKESGYLRVYGEHIDAGNYKDGSGNTVSSAFNSDSGGLVVAGDVTEFTQAEFSLDVSRDRDIHFAGNGMDSPYAEANIWQLKVNHDQEPGFIDEQEWRAFYSNTNHLMDNYTVRLRNYANPDGMKTPSTTETFGGRWMATVYQGAKDWRFGIDYRQSRQNAEKFNVNRQDLNQSLQSLVWPGVELQQWGIFSELDYQLNQKNQLRFGARFDGVQADATKADSPALGGNSPVALYRKYYGASENKTKEHNWGAMAGWYHSLNQQHKLEFRVSRSTRTADASERFMASRGSCCHGSDDWVGNPLIKPEKHHQIDAAYRFGFGRGNVSSTIYLDEISDYILRHQSSTGALLYRNVDARIYGAELALKYQYLDFKPSISVNWTRGVNKTPSSAGDENMPQIPALLTTLRLDYERQNWMLGSLCEFAANQSKTNSATGLDAGESAGFGVCHLKGRYQVSTAFRIQGGVENLFDKTHAWHVNRGNKDPLNPVSERVNEPGRQLWLGAELSF